jgi:hypothetical protein
VSNLQDEGGCFSVVPETILKFQILKANMVAELRKLGGCGQLDFAFDRLSFNDDVEPRSFCIYDGLRIEIGGFGGRFSGAQRFCD